MSKPLTCAPLDRVMVTPEPDGDLFATVPDDITHWSVRYWFPFESWFTVAAVYRSHEEAERAATSIRLGQWHERIVPGTVAALDSCGEHETSSSPTMRKATGRGHERSPPLWP